ncbi:type I inositol-1,4,5-trisphosphate 5-phosphatase [Musa troglodytarum]|uniref:Type I inositol-1,4,5-trisphosphate 5-phosphatase n=1 Tax=Musa troglodytarum TaxID=320322 RepID=A0A9E7KI00_9LILI|nr:type I inositol-1,4,5-trisphosphate 5-phosphatase [Musa troglodytarum]
MTPSSAPTKAATIAVLKKMIESAVGVRRTSGGEGDGFRLRQMVRLAGLLAPLLHFMSEGCTVFGLVSSEQDGQSLVIFYLSFLSSPIETAQTVISLRGKSWSTATRRPTDATEQKSFACYSERTKSLVASLVPRCLGGAAKAATFCTIFYPRNLSGAHQRSCT